MESDKQKKSKDTDAEFADPTRHSAVHFDPSTGITDVGDDPDQNDATGGGDDGVGDDGYTEEVFDDEAEYDTEGGEMTEGDPEDADFSGSDDEVVEPKPSRVPKRKTGGRRERELSNGAVFLMTNAENVKNRSAKSGRIKDSEMPNLNTMPADDFGGDQLAPDDAFDSEDDSRESGSDEDSDEEKETPAQREERKRRKKELDEKERIACMFVIASAGYEKRVYGTDRRTGAETYPFLTDNVILRLSTMSLAEMRSLRSAIDTYRAASDGMQEFMDGASAVQLGMTGIAYVVENAAAKRKNALDLTGYASEVDARTAANVALCGRVYRKNVKPTIDWLTGGRSGLVSDIMAMGMLMVNAGMTTHEVNKTAARNRVVAEQLRKENMERPQPTGREQMKSVGVDVDRAPPQPLDVTDSTSEFLKQWQTTAVEFDKENNK